MTTNVEQRVAELDAPEDRTLTWLDNYLKDALGYTQSLYEGRGTASQMAHLEAAIRNLHRIAKEQFRLREAALRSAASSSCSRSE